MADMTDSSVDIWHVALTWEDERVETVAVQVPSGTSKADVEAQVQQHLEVTGYADPAPIEAVYTKTT